jgi:hypothetical protein
MKHVLGKALKVGDVIETWWRPGRDRITRLLPYKGPLLEILGNGTRLADFALYKVGMTIPPEDVFVVESSAGLSGRNRKTK